jgi:dipeptidase D
VLKISEKVYRQLFNAEPDVKAIHAGLECGLFVQKYPDLDMISFGPTIKGAHTPDERIRIDTVDKFWLFLLEMLKQAPKK